MKRCIALMGFMGSGKSSVGLVLSGMLGVPCEDLDQIIESKAHQTISEMFETKGEAFFRKTESETLGRWLENGKGILSLGGGTPLREENRQMLRGSSALIVYLKTDPHTVLQRLSGDHTRPLLEGCKSEEEKLEKIRTILASREAIYRETADLIVETDGKTPREIAEAIWREIRKEEGT